MIGIFIGSFNPVTMAHVEICKLLKNKYSKIVFVPVNSRDKYLVSIKDRINMLEIISKKEDYLEVSKIMNNYSYLNYRIIDLLKDIYHDIVIIMGSDLLDKLDTFDNYEYLLEKYNFCIITRNNNVNKLIKKKYSNYRNKFIVINYHSDISSTMVRDYLKNSKDINNILDKDVYNYIKRHNLY